MQAGGVERAVIARRDRGNCPPHFSDVRLPVSFQSTLFPRSLPSMALPTIHATTILAVRKNGIVALGGDGQVSMGDTVMKANAQKVRKIRDGKVLAVKHARENGGVFGDGFTSRCPQRRTHRRDERRRALEHPLGVAALVRWVPELARYDALAETRRSDG